MPRDDIIFVDFIFVIIAKNYDSKRIYAEKNSSDKWTNEMTFFDITKIVKYT